MKKFILMVSLLVVCSITVKASADTDASNLTYVTPSVARVVIEKHFGNFVSENAGDYVSEFDDAEVLADVVDAYAEMLAQNDGFVSVDGVKNVCDVAFNDLQPKTDADNTDAQMQKCIDFATDLVSTEAAASKDCKYTVTKVNGSQLHIKYTKPDGTGFVRNGGNLPWRFFNPGAMRGSSLSCAVVHTKPNGDFAVFESEDVGRKALHLLLSTGEKYKGKTIAKAIEAYAPNQENNTAKYIARLKNMGINVNKVLPNLTTDEWTKLENAITTLEGWGPSGPSYNGTGTVDHF